MSAHRDLYLSPDLYALAFSYRQFEREADFLCQVYEAHSGRPPRSFLDLAAGPASHGMAMAARGLSVLALDRSAAMAGYATLRARDRSLILPYVVADLRAFATRQRFDLAACMLCSATYLLSDADFVAHLHQVADALHDKGLYVMELPYPSAAGASAKTRDSWTVRDATGRLEVEWIEDPATLDPATRTTESLARLHYTADDGTEVRVEDRSRQRAYTLAEVEALVATVPQLVLHAVFGALDAAVDLADESAWRMVVVLRKVAT